MPLGNKILKLRKKKGLSQEQLGEKVNVTRQTISNWELEETTPNPEQLKILSNVLNISIDELLDNRVNNVLVERTSNTEKLTGIIIKILKFIKIVFIACVIIDIIALIVFSSAGKITNISVDSSAIAICKINDNQYEIEFGSDKYFKCEDCTEEMNNEIKNWIDFSNIDSSMKNVQQYFKSKNGSCE